MIRSDESPWISAADLLAEFSQFISDKRRPTPFAAREIKRGKPQHAKQEKPKGQKARGKPNEKHYGVEAYVDPRKDNKNAIGCATGAANF